MPWIKSSERFPLPADSPFEHFRLQGRKVNGNFFTDDEGMVFFRVRGTTHEPYLIGNGSFQYLEWWEDELEPEQHALWAEVENYLSEGWAKSEDASLIRSHLSSLFTLIRK